MVNPRAIQNLNLRGFLLTDDEFEQFATRSRVGDRVAELLPEVAELDGFAGAELVHEGDGVVRVYLSEPRSMGQARSTLAKAGLVKGRIELIAAPFSEEELIQDINRAWRLIDEGDLSDVVVSIAIADDFSGIEVGIDRNQKTRRVESAVNRTLRKTIESEVVLVPDESSVEEACVSRSDCINDMRSGNRIERLNRFSNKACTMGFHVRVGSDEQFLTAGHCSHGSKSNVWYHDGMDNGPAGTSYNSATGENQTGYVGNVQQTAYATPTVIQNPGHTTVITSRDVLRVQMHDSQASDRIYGEGTPVSGYYTNAQVMLGMSVCKSGQKTFIRCGTVSKRYHTYTGGSCDCLNIGARATYYSEKGDSGSPVYHRILHAGPVPPGTPPADIKAVGIHSTGPTDNELGANRTYTRIQDALTKLGASLVT